MKNSISLYLLASATLILLQVSPLPAEEVSDTSTQEKATEAEGGEAQALPPVLVEAEGEQLPATIAENGVTATKTDTPILETPRSLSVITKERFEEQGAQTVQDALLYSSGVYGATYGFDTRGDWSLVRGADPVEYLDGLKQFFGFYNNVRPHPYALERISILKGPAAVQYGQGSIGGIINLESKLPQPEQRGQVYAEYGTYEHKETGLDVSGSIDEAKTLQYRLVGVVRDSDTQVSHVEDNIYLLSPSFTWAPTANSKLTLLLNAQQNESGSSTQFFPWEGTVLPAPNGQISSSTFISEPGFDRYDTEQYSGTIFFNHRFNEMFSFDTRTRYTRSSSDYYSMYPAFPPTFQDDNRSLLRSVYVAEKDAKALLTDSRLISNFDTGIISHKVLSGLDYQRATLNEGSFFSYDGGGLLDVYDPVYGNIPEVPFLTPAPESRTTQLGVYLQDQLTIAEHWLLTLGIRHDYAKSETDDEEQTSQSDDVVSKSAALMYVFDSGVAPYVSYSEAFTPVLGTAQDGSNFEPVEGEQYEAGIKYQPRAFPALFTAAVYELTEENRLTASADDPNESVQEGEVEIKGLELESQFRLGEFDVLASYSITDAEISKSNDDNEGNHVASVPKTLASGWVNYRPEMILPGFRIGGGVRYVGHSWDGADEIRTPAYTLFDASASYNYDDWTFSLYGRNLSDKEHVTTCLARGDCFYGQRRSVIFNVAYNF